MSSVDTEVSDAFSSAPAQVRSNSFSLATAWRIRPVRWIVYCGMLVTAAIVAVGGYAVSNMREYVLADTERELQNVASVLAEHFERTFEALTLTQLGFVQDVRSLNIKSVDEFEVRMAGQDIHRSLKQRAVNLLSVHEFLLASARGKILNSSRDWPVTADSIDETDYFKALQSSTGLPSYIGAPMQNPMTGEWRFHVAYKVTGGDGEFLGLIVGVMQLRYFEQLFATINLGRGSSVSLVRRDGLLLARYPQVDMTAAPSFGANTLFKTVLPRDGKGVVRLKGLLDNQERLIAGQNVVRHAVAASIGLDTEVALAEWRKAAIEMTGMAILILFVIGGMIFLCAQQVGIHLNRQRFKLDTALNYMSHGLCMFDAAGVLIVHNARYLEIFNIPNGLIAPGYTLREVLTRLKEVGIVNGDQDQYIAELMASLAAGKTTQSLRKLKNGRIISITNRSLPGGGWVATHEDVTTRRQAEAQIAHMAHHDALTNLPNRLLLREQLEQALHHVRRGEQLAVLYLDLDHFKSVNDTLGHGVGDALLKRVAERLRGCVRDTDIVARLGGDEFAVIQTDLEQPSDAAMLATRIRDALRQPFELDGHQVPADVSIGISIAPSDTVEPDQLLKNADMALYRSKADGRGTFRFFEPEMDERVKARRTLELDLRKAIVNGEFELYYQPLVNLELHNISCCEALLRWHHPTRGMVPPAEFIPLAEETGLINQIGEWVLRQACVEAATWPDNIAVAVNLSPVQFKNQGLALLIVSVLADSGLPAHRLEVEITEAVLLQNNEVTLATLRQLQQLGVRIAMDDFGTGYSSLSYLRSFPFDKIKIDRSFINDVADKDDSSAIVQAVTELASRLHMATTAEGVETKEQFEKIQALGCTEMQGFLFSRPLPAKDIVRLFTSRQRKSVSFA